MTARPVKLLPKREYYDQVQEPLRYSQTVWRFRIALTFGAAEDGVGTESSSSSSHLTDVMRASKCITMVKIHWIYVAQLLHGTQFYNASKQITFFGISVIIEMPLFWI